MYQKLLEVLLSSSISNLISHNEIEEIAIELESELQIIVNEQIEDVKDELEETHTKEVDRLTWKIDDLRFKLSSFNDNFPKIENAADVMTMKWINENWEHMVKLQFLNIDGKKLVSIVDKKLLLDEINNLDPMSSRILAKAANIPFHKRIILVGKAASGKDHARKQFEKRGFVYGISYTTRPPRLDEIDKKDYFFVSTNQFEKMISQDNMYEYVIFNGWYYGTSNAQFHTEDIFIMTPKGISKIKPEDRLASLIIYLDIPYDIRKERLALRNDADSVERRLEADEQDFKDFNDFDIRITNLDGIF